MKLEQAALLLYLQAIKDIYFWSNAINSSQKDSTVTLIKTTSAHI